MISIHVFPFLYLPACERKQSWKGLRKRTGSTVLCYSVMDVWTVFENMKCFWTCRENVSSLCCLSQTSFMLLSERWLFVGGYFLFVCGFLKLFFPQYQAWIPLFQFKPVFFTSVRMQRDAFCLFHFSFFDKKVSSCFPPLHVRSPKPLLTEQKYNIFFFSLSHLLLVFFSLQ